MDNEQAEEMMKKQCHSIIPIEIIDYRTIVFYSNTQQSTKPEERFTLYALLAKLALDGKSNVKVNYHTMGVAEKPESASIGRFSISPNRKKCECAANHNGIQPLAAQRISQPSRLSCGINSYVFCPLQTLKTSSSRKRGM